MAKLLRRRIDSNRLVKIAIAVSVFLVIVPAALQAQTFQWPVDNPVIGQVYACESCLVWSTSSDRYKSGINFHGGVDLTPSGTTCSDYTKPVKAAADGLVQSLVARQNSHGYGNTIILRHANGKYTLYGHLDSWTAGLTLNQFVSRGTQIGIMGNSSSAAARDASFCVHVHFEVKDYSTLENGNTSDLYWGYTPGHPDYYGYRDPRLYVQALSEEAITPVPVMNPPPGAVNVRSSPGVTYVSPTGTDPVDQIGENQGFVTARRLFYEGTYWYFVDLPSTNGPIDGSPHPNNGSNGGWVSGNVVTQDPSACQVRLLENAVRVRSSPSTSSSALAKLYQGQRFVTFGSPAPAGNGCDGQWYKIYLPSRAGAVEGWCCEQAGGLRLLDVSCLQQPISVTVQTSPSGRSFSVDGTPYTTPQTFSWTPGSSHTIATTSPQSGGAGTQYIFSDWSDGGAISHTVAPPTGTTYTANFTTQYYLTMQAGTGGTVTPPGGWHNSGDAMLICATANSGYTFSGWTGGCYAGATACPTITMSSPCTQTASFTANPSTIAVTFQTVPSSLQVLIDGYFYTTPKTFDWVPGQAHVITGTSPQSGGTGVQYVFASWSDGQPQTHVITVPSSAATYTANFTTQYYLTMQAGTGGTVTPPSNWYNSGVGVQVHATPNSGYSFSGWTGSGTGFYTGTNNPATVTMNGPITQIANFEEATAVENIESDELPRFFCLFQNYPNPFNANTEIRFTVSTLDPVSVVVYDILGRQIVGLVDQQVLSPGLKSVTWDGLNFEGSPVPSGMYFYRMTAGAFAETRKMVLMK